MNEPIDFDKMQGLLPAIVQDAGNGEVLMLGFMNREALSRRCAPVRHFFQPHPQPALDQGRDFGQPAGGGFGGNRLRSRHRPVASTRAREGVVCHRGTRSCSRKISLRDEAARSEGSLP